MVNEWLKQAILLFFKVSAIEVTELGPFEYADRLPLKHGFKEAGVRVVPGASARWGSFIGRGAVMMPSYVNIGAHVGPGRWWTPGPRSVAVPRSGPASTWPAASASAECWNLRRPHPS